MRVWVCMSVGARVRVYCAHGLPFWCTILYLVGLGDNKKNYYHDSCFENILIIDVLSLDS